MQVYEGRRLPRLRPGCRACFVAPVLTWNISDNTDLTLEFNYLNDERPFDEGLFSVGIPDIPYDRVFKIQMLEDRLRNLVAIN